MKAPGGAPSEMSEHEKLELVQNSKNLADLKLAIGIIRSGSSWVTRLKIDQRKMNELFDAVANGTYDTPTHKFAISDLMIINFFRKYKIVAKIKRLRKSEASNRDSVARSQKQREKLDSEMLQNEPLKVRIKAAKNYPELLEICRNINGENVVFPPRVLWTSKDNTLTPYNYRLLLDQIILELENIIKGKLPNVNAFNFEHSIGLGIWTKLVEINKTEQSTFENELKQFENEIDGAKLTEYVKSKGKILDLEYNRIYLEFLPGGKGTAPTALLELIKKIKAKKAQKEIRDKETLTAKHTIETEIQKINNFEELFTFLKKHEREVFLLWEVDRNKNINPHVSPSSKNILSSVTDIINGLRNLNQADDYEHLDEFVGSRFGATGLIFERCRIFSLLDKKEGRKRTIEIVKAEKLGYAGDDVVYFVTSKDGKMAEGIGPNDAFATRDAIRNLKMGNYKISNVRYTKEPLSEVKRKADERQSVQDLARVMKEVRESEAAKADLERRRAAAEEARAEAEERRARAEERRAEAEEESARAERDRWEEEREERERRDEEERKEREERRRKREEKERTVDSSRIENGEGSGEKEWRILSKRVRKLSNYSGDNYLAEVYMDDGTWSFGTAQDYGSFGGIGTEATAIANAIERIKSGKLLHEYTERGKGRRTEF